MIHKLPIRVNINVTTLKGRPCIVFRRHFLDEKIIRGIVQAALYSQPIVVLPEFSDKIRGINMLMEKGVLYWNSTKSIYEFCI